MKKTFILLISIISFTFFINISTAYSCPEGYSENTVTAYYQYNIGTTTMQCPFTITYCCKWDVVSHKVVAIIDEITLSEDYSCWIFIPDWNDYFDWVNLTTATAAYESCGPAFPPCDENNPAIVTDVKSIQCKKLKHFNPILGDDVWVTKFINCNLSNYCLITYHVCTDYNTIVPETGKPKVIWTLISSEQYGIPECPTTFPTLPPYGETWETDWETECFTNGCN